MRVKGVTIYSPCQVKFRTSHEAIEDAVAGSIVAEYGEGFAETFFIRYIIRVGSMSIHPVAIFFAPTNGCEGYLEVRKVAVLSTSPCFPLSPICSQGGLWHTLR